MPAPRAVVSTLPVTSQVGTPPLRTFRKVLQLRFEVDGLAQEIAVDAAATVLRGRLSPLSYNALQPGAPMAPATLRAADGAVIVELDAPRRLLSVQLAPAKVLEPGSALLVHRLDGQAIAEKPTATAGQSAAHVFAFDFTDARFALRLRNTGGQSVPLSAADVAAVQVRAEATGARLGIAPLADPLATPDLFWPQPGDAGATGELDAGARLARTMERHLAALPPPAGAVDVALVIAADAPFELALQALAVPYRLVRRALGSGGGKEVLRFGAGGAAHRSVVLRLPGGASVVSATLETVPSLRGDRPAPGNAGGTAAVEPAEQNGVRVSGSAWAAQKITPSQALAVSGIAVGLLGLTAGAELTVELREDHQGEPTGRRLSAGSLTLEQAGRRVWANVFLPAPVILPAQPCWLLLTAASGEAVWLAREGAASPRVLAGPAGSQAALQGLETLHLLLTREDRQPETAETPALELRVAGEPVAANPQTPDGRTSYDLVAALNRVLPAAAGPLEIPLTFAAAVPGTLTVYPPRIEYEPRP